MTDVKMLSKLAILFVIVHMGSSAVTFPKTWKRCKQSDPALNKCLSVAVLDVLQKLENKGIPSLGVFPIDPLMVNNINIVQGGDSPVSFKLGFKNLSILGIAKSRILDYKANLKEFKLYSKSVTPEFRLVGNYTMGGRILLLPIQGEGACDIVLEDLETEHFLSGSLSKVDGKEYMKMDEYRISFKPKKMTTQFDNLFNGDKALGATMNSFMNDNWESIFKEMRPTLEDTFGTLFKEITNRIFTKLPFNEIFLP